MIKILAETEQHALAFAKQCSKARRVLERVEGLSPAPDKGSKIPVAVLVDITNRRRMRMTKKTK